MPDPFNLDRARLDTLIQKRAAAEAAAGARAAERAQKDAERAAFEAEFGTAQQRQAETLREREAFEAEFGDRAERARESAARRAESEARRVEAEARRVQNERLRRVREARELYGFEDFLREAPAGALPSLISHWTGTAGLTEEVQGFLGQLQGRIGWDLLPQDFADWLLRRWQSYARRQRAFLPKGPKAPPKFRSPFAQRPG